MTCEHYSILANITKWHFSWFNGRWNKIVDDIELHSNAPCGKEEVIRRMNKYWRNDLNELRLE